MRAARLGLVLVSALTLASLATTGCGSAGTEPQTQTQTATTTTDSTATIAPVAANSHGMVKFIGDALSQVSLRSDQRVAIEKLATDAEARHQAALPLRANLANAIAAQVESGKIDEAALQPQIDALTANFQAQRPLDHAAFQKMHDLLDATQRQAFVDAVHANMQAQKGEHKGMRGEKMQEWATALNLTDAQKDQIKTSMQTEFAAHMKATNLDKDPQAGGNGGGPGGRGGRGHILDNFVADNFSIDQAAPAQADMKDHVAQMTTHGVHFVEVILPTLTADQRKLAADKIRSKGAAQEEEQGPAPF